MNAIQLAKLLKSDLLKAKYLRKYKGKNGKWIYVYRLPTGKHAHIAAEEVVHTPERLKAMFRRRDPGKGGAKHISSRKDLDYLLNNSTFCMISAGRNPERSSDKHMSDAQIRRRDAKLKQDLIDKGFMYTPAKGRYGEPEESLFVMCHDANKEELMRLGTKYHQDTILFVENGKSDMIKTTGDSRGEAVMSGSGYEYVPDADDFYTEVEIAGNPVRFTMTLADIVKAIRLVVGRFFK
jgi:hypothetical protein